MISLKTKNPKLLDRCFCAVALFVLFLVSSPQVMAQELDAATIKLFMAVDKKNVGLAKIEIKEGADFYAQNDHGRTAINLAMDAGDFYLVQYLLNERDKQDENGLSKPVKADQRPVKQKINEVVEFSKPPAYLPSKPIPMPKPGPRLKPVVVQNVVNPQPKVQPQARVEDLTLSKTAPASKFVPEPEPEPKAEPKPKQELNMKAKPIDQPLPIVSFVPNTKNKLKPVRTFFLKTMTVHVQKKPMPIKMPSKVRSSPQALPPTPPHTMGYGEARRAYF